MENKQAFTLYRHSALIGNVRFTPDLPNYTPSPRCIRTRPSPSRERGVARMRGHGFTLIELLVVILIIGILAAVALPQYKISVEKSRAMQVLSGLKAIASAEETYYLENGTYTNNMNELNIMVKNIDGWRFVLMHDNNNKVQANNSKLSMVLYFQHANPAPASKVYCWSTQQRGKDICKTMGTPCDDTGQRWCL